MPFIDTLGNYFFFKTFEKIPEASVATPILSLARRLPFYLASFF